MKPFNLDEAMAGKPICTRNGHKARIIVTDIKNNSFPIAAAFTDPTYRTEQVKAYTKNGTILISGEHCLDLMMAEDEEPKCPFKPFDKVLIRDGSGCSWCCALFSHIEEVDGAIYYYCHGFSYDECIPYNEETAHLVGTTDNAPEKYVIW